MKQFRSLRKKHLGLVVSAITAMLAGTSQNAAFAAEELEEITVTGSRIVRRDLSAPSPITTVGGEAFENSSTGSIESVLNQLPQFVPGATQFSNSIQNSATSTPGAATLNLRGLGANRNLILIDGRRAQPSNAALIVDVNTIPASAIANVEVITGGASAVYGPDAMAGVVNFILKSDFEGIEMDFQTGETFDGDAAENRFSTLLGMNSADGNGNIMIGLDWMKRNPALQRDRDFFINGWSDPRNNSGGFVMPRSFFPTAGNLPTQAAMNAIFPGLAAGSVGPSTEVRFNEDGTPFIDNRGGHGYKGPLNCFGTEQCGVYSGIVKKANGDLQQWGTEGYLSTPLERHSVFMRGTYDLADNISAFAQANYTRVDVTQRGGVPPAITVWQAPNVPRDGRALPAALNTLLDSRATPTAPWALFQVLEYNGPVEPVNTNDVWQMMAGLKGELFDGDWTWEAYGSRGDTRIVAENFRLPSLQRYQDMVYGANFGRGRVTRPDGGRGYVLECTTGLPVFQDFTPSQNCLNSIDTRLINRSNLSQEILEANLQGGLIDLPAGEVRFAAGASYRGNGYTFMPGNPSGQLRDNPIGVFASAPTGGKISVREFYGELLVPVIGETDIPFVRNIDLELGYRYSDFNTAGGQDTYKAMFTWGASDIVTIRGGYQQATRAPNIAELYTAQTQEVVPFPQQDPCAVTTLAPWGNVASNPNRTKVQNLCRAIIGNNTSQFDTQTFSITGIPGPSGFHRQNPPFFPLEIALRQGNPNVGPEIGKTFTLGAVISEPFGLENLNITVDAYDIEITDAINPLNVATAYDNCFNSDGVSNPTYDRNNSWCKGIRRNPVTGDREEVDTPFDNLGMLQTRGIDTTVSWSKDIGPGMFSVNSTINYLDNFEYQLAPGGRIVDATGSLDQGGLFDFQTFTRFGYAWENVNLGLTWRHMSDAKSAAAALVPATTIQGPGAYDMFNFNGSYNWDKYTFRFGVDNLFEVDPELTQSNPLGAGGGDTDSDVTNAGLYDLLGRRWYVGVKASF
jgi:outer membrane receptor protein involved in Fe transport